MKNDLEKKIDEMNEYHLKYDTHTIQIQYDSVNEILRETCISLNGDNVISSERCYKNSNEDGYKTYLTRIDINNNEFDKWYYKND